MKNDEQLTQAVIDELQARGVVIDDSVIEHVVATVSTLDSRGLSRDPAAIASDLEGEG